MLSQFLPDEPSKTTEIQTPIIKIRGRTLIFGNVVYQIHNIASIGLVDLTTIRPIPKLYIALLLVGVALFLFIADAGAKIVGVLITAFTGWLIYRHNQSKINARYGMTIYTNSGTKTILTSRSEDFIKKVILSLYEVMNSDEFKAMTINFATLDMSVDNSVQIGTNIGSSVVTGHVGGDVVSNV